MVHLLIAVFGIQSHAHSAVQQPANLASLGKWLWKWCLQQGLGTCRNYDVSLWSQVLDDIISSIRLGCECLTLPRKRTLEEIVRNPSLVCNLFSLVLWRCCLGGRKGIWPVKNMEWSGAGMVICLERGANDLHMVQLMPLTPHYLLLQQNPEWFILLVLAYPGCPGKKAVKRLCVCVSRWQLDCASIIRLY